MKRIGIISDTHGTFDDTLREFLKDVDEIWHAGDIGSIELADRIAAFKPLRAVSGNIDGGMTRRVYPAFQAFECERVQVLMTHIGGYPRHYDPRAVQKIQSVHPKLFIAGHSHPQGIYDPSDRHNPGLPGVRFTSPRQYALRSTARRCATWRSAVAPQLKTQRAEIKPSPQESPFPSQSPEIKFLYPKAGSAFGRDFDDRQPEILEHSASRTTKPMLYNSVQVLDKSPQDKPSQPVNPMP